MRAKFSRGHGPEPLQTDTRFQAKRLAPTHPTTPLAYATSTETHAPRTAQHATSHGSLLPSSCKQEQISALPAAAADELRALPQPDALTPTARPPARACLEEMGTRAPPRKLRIPPPLPQTSRRDNLLASQLPVQPTAGASRMGSTPRRFTLEEAGARHPLRTREGQRSDAQLSRSPVYHVSSRSAASFVFPAREGAAPSGWQEQLLDLQRSEGGAPLATERWVLNHYRWIVWKLACQQRCFPRLLGQSGFTPLAVGRQLLHRYEREFNLAQRPVLRQIYEGDESPSCHMVLCIAGVDHQQGSLELTDGWYSMWAKCDLPLMRQLAKRRLYIGLKLRLCGASRLGSIEKAVPWELQIDSSSPMMQLHANGTRRAEWHCKLGRCRTRTFRVLLDSLEPGGGQAILACHL
ncbi:MAG: hypothetical protein SGPRY_012507 [Prymnesium sp.]